MRPVRKRVLLAGGGKGGNAMRKAARVLLTVAALSACLVYASLAAADTVELKNGEVLRGRTLGKLPDKIFFKTDAGKTMMIPKKNIRKYTKGGSAGVAKAGPKSSRKVKGPVRSRFGAWRK